MDNIFVLAFEAAFEEDIGLRETHSVFRRCASKIGNAYHTVRMEGLEDALRMLTEVASSPACATSDGNPFDMVKASLSAAQQRQKQQQSSASSSSPGGGAKQQWEQLQRAARSNLPSAMFSRIFPRASAFFAAQAAGGTVELPQSAALAWRSNIPIATLCANAARASSAARVGLDNNNNSPGNRSPFQNLIPNASLAGAPACVAAPPVSFFDSLKEVTLKEQALCLRVLQGLCLILPHQKHYVNESAFMSMVQETFSYAKQHIEALRQSANELADDAGASSPVFASTMRSSIDDETLGETVGSPAATVRPEPVAMDPQQEAVLIALVDSVEAACHYNPRGLAQFVNSGAAKATLALALTPHTPIDLRCAILDVVSLLMQEVAPFRRAVLSNKLVVAPDLDPAASHPSTTAIPGEHEKELSVVDQMLNAVDGGAMRLTDDSAPLTRYLMDRASASKFDSLVRDMLSQRNLTRAIGLLIPLRNVKGQPISASTPKSEVHRILQKANRQRQRQLETLLSVIDKALKDAEEAAKKKSEEESMRKWDD